MSIEIKQSLKIVWWRNEPYTKVSKNHLTADGKRTACGMVINEKYATIEEEEVIDCVLCKRSLARGSKR